MKTKTRIASLILLIALAFASISILAGCAKDPTPKPNDTRDTAQTGNTPDGPSSDPAGSSENTSTEETVPTFVDADYQGASFVIRARKETASSYPSEYLVSDDPSDIVKSQVIKRNDAIKNKYNVVVEVQEVDDPYKQVATLIETGDIDFDVILDSRCRMATIAKNGNLYNFNKLKNVNLTASYWDANAYEQYTISNKLFFMPNDISVSNFGRVRCLFYNRDLVTDYKIEDPQNLLDQNKWTLEEFLKLATSVSSDEDGNGTWTVDDVFGAFIEEGSSNGSILSLVTGCGIQYTKTNDEGRLAININNEKTTTVLEKISNSFKSSTAITTIQSITKTGDSSGFANNYDYARNLFANGHALFIWANPAMTVQFDGANFGVLPNPKYDEGQKFYFHRMDPYALIFAIPNSSKINYEKVANVMEFGGYTSSQTVIKAYYENVLQGRRVKTPKDAEILDLIKNSIRYEITDIFSLGIPSILDTAYTSGNFASTIKTMSGPVSKNITKLYEDIDNIN